MALTFAPAGRMNVAVRVPVAASHSNTESWPELLTAAAMLLRSGLNAICEA
jgi:hypothetical protein